MSNPTENGDRSQRSAQPTFVYTNGHTDGDAYTASHQETLNLLYNYVCNSRQHRLGNRSPHTSTQSSGVSTDHDEMEIDSAPSSQSDSSNQGHLCLPNGHLPRCSTDSADYPLTPDDPLLSLCRARQPSPVDQCLRRLTMQFEERYKAAQGSLLNDVARMGDEDPRRSFESVLSQLFRDNINWGRVIAMVAFVAAMFDQVELREGRAKAEEYLDWAVEFIHSSTVWPWIEQHGGWAGLMEFETGSSSDSSESDLWKSLTSVAKIAAGAIGVVAFCRLLVNRI